VKQPESGRECPVSDIVHDGTPQVTATADARAKDNRSYAAGFHRGLPTSTPSRLRSRPSLPDGRALHSGPYPPDLSRCHAYGALTLVPHVYRLISLAGPGPSGSTKPSRLCRRCFPPSPASPGSGCAQLPPGCCDSPARRSRTSFDSQRLTAHPRLVAHRSLCQSQFWWPPACRSPTAVFIPGRGDLGSIAAGAALEGRAGGLPGHASSALGRRQDRQHHVPRPTASGHRRGQAAARAGQQLLGVDGAEVRALICGFDTAPPP